MRPIYQIAREIQADWKNIGPYYDYLKPLFIYNKIDEADPKLGFKGAARSAVQSFLCNCSTWKGETAKRIKMELKEMLKN